MRFKRKFAARECKLNMTPMIDVVFLLLIFFMLVNELRRMAEEAVILPFAAHAQDDTQDIVNRVVVNVTKAKGPQKTVRFVISKNDYSKEALEKHLQKEAVKMPDPTGAADLSGLSVKIRADAYVEFKHVQIVLLACMKANIWKVSFGVAPEMKKEGE